MNKILVNIRESDIFLHFAEKVVYEWEKWDDTLEIDEELYNRIENFHKERIELWMIIEDIKKIKR